MTASNFGVSPGRWRQTSARRVSAGTVARPHPLAPAGAAQMARSSTPATVKYYLQVQTPPVERVSGKVSHDLALDHAHAEFTKFDAERRPVRRSLGEDAELVSDFDQQVKQLEQQPPTKPKKKPAPCKRKTGDAQ